MKFSVLVGTAVAEMKHELSAYILIPNLAVLYTQLK